MSLTQKRTGYSKISFSLAYHRAENAGDETVMFFSVRPYTKELDFLNGVPISVYAAGLPKIG